MAARDNTHAKSYWSHISLTCGFAGRESRFGVQLGYPHNRPTPSMRSRCHV